MIDPETRIANLEKAVQDLLRRVTGDPPPANFTEYRGALFKQRVPEEYIEAVYCPLCILPAGPVSQGLYRCERCSIVVDVGVGELSIIIHNYVKHIGKYRSITHNKSPLFQE